MLFCMLFFSCFSRTNKPPQGSLIQTRKNDLELILFSINKLCWFNCVSNKHEIRNNYGKIKNSSHLLQFQGLELTFIIYPFLTVFKSILAASFLKEITLFDKSGSWMLDGDSVSLLFRTKTGKSHDCSHLIRGSCIILGHFFDFPLFILSLFLPVFFNLLFLKNRNNSINSNTV